MSQQAEDHLDKLVELQEESAHTYAEARAAADNGHLGYAAELQRKAADISARERKLRLGE